MTPQKWVANINKAQEYRVFMDGTAWCATGLCFVNLQESNAGFGDTPLAALTALIEANACTEELRRGGVRQWRCNNCRTEFGYRTPHDQAPCPRCSCGSQYTYEIVRS